MIDKFTLEIKVGDKVETGRFHLANQEIKAIEIDKWGHPVLVLESGRKKGVCNVRFKKLIPADVVRKQEPADIMMTTGLSRRKAEYLIGLATEINAGTLDLPALADLPGDEVQTRLTRIRGIGSWTADNYRLFALADLDAWPVNDIALQEGMKLLKSLEIRPSAPELEVIAEHWRPYRGAGALVLWHLYGILVRNVTVADI